MINVFSCLKRKSFAKIFSMSFFPLVLLSGFTFSKDSVQETSLNSLHLFPHIVTQETETIHIPFETEVVVDMTVKPGERLIAQSGQVGIKNITYTKKYTKGGEFENMVHNVKTTQEPVNEVIKIAPEGRNCTLWFNIVDSMTGDQLERDILKTLIKCESHCNSAKNNRDKYIGLLQFSPKTFQRYGGINIWDGREQIVTALKIIRSGGVNHHWPTCSKNVN
jgi:hypothetical protein